MTRIAFAAALALAVTLPAVSAQAQFPRTFVSAAGSDSNNCANVATPCRHFQAAVNATAEGGEVAALDPANYGSITISQAITIEGQGWSYIAPPAGGNGITINAVSGKVTIHGVLLNGAGITGGTNGIRFNSGDSLTVTDCAIQNFTMDGLGFFATASTPQSLTVSNSSFNDNSNNGLAVETFSSGSVTAAVDRSTFSGNHVSGLLLVGLFGTGPLTIGVTDSVAANNGSQGYFVESKPGQSVSNLSLTHSMAEGNGTGVQASGTNSTIWLAQSTVTGNLVSFDADTGGIIQTYGDNYLQAANGAAAGSLTSATKQ